MHEIKRESLQWFQTGQMLEERKNHLFQNNIHSYIHFINYINLFIRPKFIFMPNTACTAWPDAIL